MFINHDMQDVQAEVSYRRDALQRAVAGSRRRRRSERRWSRAGRDAVTTRIPTDA